MEYIGEMLAALSGAGMGALGNWLLVRQRARRANGLNEYAAKIITDENFELRQRINLVESYNAKHIHRIAELEREIFEVRHQIEIMQFAPFNIPLPMWMKNWAGVVDYINDEYEEIFLKPRGLSKADYMGKTDFSVWGKDIAEEYRKNDREVMETGKTFNGRETVVDGMGHETKWRVMKFPRAIPKGVAGIAFPDNGYFDKYFETKNNKK